MEPHRYTAGKAGRLERYHLLHAVPGGLLDKLGRHAEAAAAFARGAALVGKMPERSLLRPAAARTGAGADQT